MRSLVAFAIWSMLFTGLTLGTYSDRLASSVGVVTVAAQSVPNLDIDVDIDRESSAWYRDPMWVAIGGLAVLLLVVLLVVAFRGNGPTIVRD